MKKIKRVAAFVMLALVAGMTIASCNKDDNIILDKPTITLDSESGVYEVRGGNSLTISPRYGNAEGATYTWKLDG